MAFGAEVDFVQQFQRGLLFLIIVSIQSQTLQQIEKTFNTLWRGDRPWRGLLSLDPGDEFALGLEPDALPLLLMQ